jgi:pyridoxamine 5'-phosphate oxidase
MESLGRHEDYGQEALNETHLVADPLEQFKLWLKESEHAEIYEPNAFVLSTVTTDNQPRARTVLLKGVDEHGFFFATNYLSKKGQAISANPKVSAVFGWYSIYHQVIIEGVAKVVPEVESDEYHNSRPHDSQVAAWSSHQSQFIENRDALDEQFEEALKKFKDIEVPRPDYWGGYRIIPTRIEFWKGRSNRMHDRIEYVRSQNSDGSFSDWEIQRLQP